MTHVSSSGTYTDYCFVTNDGSTMTWLAAQGICVSLNYTSLAVIDTVDKQAFLYDYGQPLTE